MRRVVHLVLFLSVIVTVRACGGMIAAEDRIAANTRWVAEKTGVAALSDRWRDNVAPRINGAARNGWQRVEQATATALERLGSRTGSVRNSIDSGAASAARVVKSGSGDGSSKPRSGGAAAPAPGSSNGQAP